MDEDRARRGITRRAQNELDATGLPRRHSAERGDGCRAREGACGVSSSRTPHVDQTRKADSTVGVARCSQICNSSHGLPASAAARDDRGGVPPQGCDGAARRRTDDAR